MSLRTESGKIEKSAKTNVSKKNKTRSTVMGGIFENIFNRSLNSTDSFGMREEIKINIEQLVGSP